MKFYLIFFLLGFEASAQSFYVNTGYPGLQDAHTYRLSISPCDSFGDDDTPSLLPTCVPTQTLQAYDDIAIDKANNIWYVSNGGDLYKRNLNDTTCTYIGDFTPNDGVVNALVSDSTGDLYAVSNWPDTCRLLKYDHSGFHDLGILPKQIYSSGDLFFYEHRLFLLSYYDSAENSFLTEIAIKDPSKSCRYMSLDNLVTFGAFAIKEGSKSRTFVLKSNPSDYLTSSLVEIDIPGKKILNTTCQYPFVVRGAATFYDRTRDSGQCIGTPQGIANIDRDRDVIVLNPCYDVVRFNDVAKHSRVKTITLHDLSGKKIKNFPLIDFPNNLNISDVEKGLYLIHLAFEDLGQSVQKVQKD